MRAMVARILAFLLALLPAVALAQPGPPPGNITGVPATGGLFTGTVTVGSGTTLVAVIDPAATQNCSGCFGTTIVYDPSTGGGNLDDRWNMFQTTLSPSTATTDTWENLNSFVTLSGAAGGSSSREINVLHSFFDLALGATANGNVETTEQSAAFYGTMHGQFSGNLITLENMSTGVITGNFIGLNVGLKNDNVAAGSIAQWVAIEIGAVSGAGSAPTTDFAILDKDTVGVVALQGQLTFGTGAAATSTHSVHIQGQGTDSTTFPLFVVDSSGANQFFVTDGKSATFAGAVTVGTNGATAGAVQFDTTTAGESVKLISGTGASSTNALLTLPQSLGNATLAVANQSQTISATQTFSGTLNVSGSLQSGGVAGANKSCAVTTANVATGITLTISNGIITGTTTC